MMMVQLTPRKMVVRLGFSQDLAEKIFNGKYIESIDEWLNLDNDDVKKLPRNFQKPGGVGEGGIISFKAEMNPHLTVLFILHKNRTSLSVEYIDITVPKFHAFKKQ